MLYRIEGTAGNRTELSVDAPSEDAAISRAGELKTEALAPPAKDPRPWHDRPIGCGPLVFVLDLCVAGCIVCLRDSGPAPAPVRTDDSWKTEVRRHLAKAEAQAAYLDGVMDVAAIHAREVGLTHLVSDVRGHLDRAKGHLTRIRTALDRGDRATVP